MNWQLSTTATFDRRAARFLKKHPDDLHRRFVDTLTYLTTDPFDPGLRLHALSGKLQGVQAVSINYSYPITLTLQITEHSVLLLDIGSHDEVYR